MGHPCGVATSKRAGNARFLHIVCLHLHAERRFSKCAAKTSRYRRRRRIPRCCKQPGKCKPPVIGENNVSITIKMADRRFLDCDLARNEIGANGIVKRDSPVGHECHGAPFRNQLCLMYGHRPGRDHADAPLIEFIAMTVRAMKDTLAPALRQSFDLRKSVAHTGCEQNSSAFMPGALGRHDSERIFLSCDGFGRILDPGQRRIRLKLRAGGSDNLRRVNAILTKKSMSVLRKTVAACSSIDHENTAPGAKKLQRSCHPGITAADDDHIMLHGYPFRVRRAA